jgi:hypothetical protein
VVVVTLSGGGDDDDDLLFFSSMLFWCFGEDDWGKKDEWGWLVGDIGCVNVTIFSLFHVKKKQKGWFF